MKYYIEMETPVGRLWLLEEEEQLAAICASENSIEVSNYDKRETSVLKEAKKQLLEYFEGKRQTFDLPLRLNGTAFQVKCWQALMDIPYGETRSYKDIAEAIDCPKGYRAVGLANNKNKHMIIIPCHRVIGSNGQLVGYAGGIGMKEKLLDFEKE